MLEVLARKVLLMIPTLVGIVFTSFVFIHIIPGDPVNAIAGERSMTAERRAELLAEIWPRSAAFIPNFLVTSGKSSTVILDNRLLPDNQF